MSVPYPLFRRGLAAAALLCVALLTAHHASAQSAQTSHPEWVVSACETLATKHSRFARFLERLLGCDKILPVNTAPVAVATASPVTSTSAYFLLNGSQSNDPENDALTYQWVQIAGPDAVVVDDLSSVSPTLYAPTGSAGSGLIFELTVSDGEFSSTAEVIVDVPQCYAEQGEVFINCVDSAWAGISAWEMLSDGSYENYHYVNGHNDFQAQWQIMDSGDVEHENVIDIHYASSDDANAMVRIYTEYGVGATVDMSAYEYGTLEFDLRVIDWGAQPSLLEVVMECVYPCTSAPYPIDDAVLGEWKTYQLPLQFFIDSGLDIHNTEMGFQISPPWGLQNGVHFQVDNIRWVEGEPPSSGSSHITYTFDTPETIEDWEFRWHSGNGSTPNKTHADGAMVFTPEWVSGEDFFAHFLTLENSVDLTKGILRSDVSFSSEYVENSEVGISIMLMDVNGYLAGGAYYSASQVAIGDSWITLDFIHFETELAWADEAFDLSQVSQIAIGLHAQGETPTANGSIRIDNLDLEFIETDIVPDIGNPPPGYVDIYGLNYFISNYGESPDYDMVFDFDQTGTEFLFRPYWQQEEFAVGVFFERPDSFTIYEGRLDFQVFIPLEAVGSNGTIDVTLVDAYGNRGHATLLHFDTVTESGWVSLSLNPVTPQTLTAGASFDYNQVAQVNLEITRGDAPEGFFGEFRIKELFITSNTDIGDGGGPVDEDGLTFLAFDPYNWSFAFWSGAPIVDWVPGENSLTLSPQEVSANDHIALINHFPHAINLTGGALQGDVRVPADLFNSLQYFDIFVWDENYNYASLRFSDLYTLNVDENTDLGLLHINEDTLANYEIQLDRIIALGIQFYFANDQYGISDSIEFTNFGLRYDSNLPIGVEPPEEDQFVGWSAFPRQGSPNVSHYSGVTFNVTPEWVTDEDEITVRPYLPSPINAHNGTLGLEMGFPALPGSPTTAVLYMIDAYGNQATSHVVNIGNFNEASWYWFDINFEYQTGLSDLPPGFDASQITDLEIVISSNGSPLGSSGEFSFTHVSYSSGTQAPNLLETLYFYGVQGSPASAWFYGNSEATLIPGWSSEQDWIHGQIDMPELVNALGGDIEFEVFAPTPYMDTHLLSRIVITDVQGNTAAGYWFDMDSIAGTSGVVGIYNIGNGNLAEAPEGFDYSAILTISIEFYANGVLQPEAEIQIQNLNINTPPLP